VVVLLGASGTAAASEFPAGRTGYHSYTELTAEVAAVAAAHPDIVWRFSIGKSYQGRDIWAVKISDNVRSTRLSRRSSSTAVTTRTSTWASR
jgi:hypothetical protein